jgi:ubiquinone/menaquinone biosynthesis C-methylase UbiE
MYRVTKPGGRLLTADMAPLMHLRIRGLRPDTASADPLADLATAAGYQIESWGKVPLLRYVVAIRRA